jgi:hypothetical protein
MNTESSRNDTPFRYRKLGRIGLIGSAAILALWASRMIILPGGTALGWTALQDGFIVLIVVYLLARVSRLARRKRQ